MLAPHAPRRLLRRWLATATLVPGLSPAPGGRTGPPAAAPATPAPIRTPRRPRRRPRRPRRPRHGAADGRASARPAPRLGAPSVRWNAFGTPASILPPSGSLGAASSGDAAVAARAWLRRHADRASASPPPTSTASTLVNDQKLAGSDARAVLFRQDFGGLAPALGSMVTVGVAQRRDRLRLLLARPRRPATLARRDAAPPARAWLKAADQRRPATRRRASRHRLGPSSGGWTRLNGPRLRPGAAGPAPRPGRWPTAPVRPVFEANVRRRRRAALPSAYTLLVDARHAATVLAPPATRSSNSADDHVSSGAVHRRRGCGPKHPFELDRRQRPRSITVARERHHRPTTSWSSSSARGDALLATGDTRHQPRGRPTYSPGAHPGRHLLGAGLPLRRPDRPRSARSGTYAVVGHHLRQRRPSTGDLPNPPDAGATSPPTRRSTTRPTHDPDELGRRLLGPPAPAARRRPRRCATSPHSGPWDTTTRSGCRPSPRVGNNANTARGLGQPADPRRHRAGAGLPHPRVHRPRSPTPGTTRKCDPTELRPGRQRHQRRGRRNLFVAHNRMHDYSYYLGFTEANYNLQHRQPRPRRPPANDPEIGNAQAGALTGGTPSLPRRDNANQITLQDGIAAASPTSTSSSRSPARSTPRASTATST